MATPPLTTFPSLFSTRAPGTHNHEKEFTIPAYCGFKLPREFIYLGWAKLVHAYTHDEPVVFASDEGVNSVSSNSLRSIHFFPVRDFESPGICTAVYFSNHRKLTRPFLYLYHESKSGNAWLSSESDIPVLHLNEIATQLQNILSPILLKLKQLGTQAPQQGCLSISNPRPQLVEVPSFLHDTIANHELSEQTAIKYVGPAGWVSQVSYRELARWSRTLAVRIQRRLDQLDAPAKQSIVPIYSEQTPALYVAQLAVSQSGNAFCPIALDAPKQRIKHILDDIKAELILTTRSLQDRLVGSGRGLLFVEDDDDNDGGIKDIEIPRRWVSLSPKSMCYIMYTSGSTGKPKGVQLSHAVVMQSLYSHKEQIPHYCQFLQFAAPTFDVSIFETFFTFLRGATLVCCDREYLLNNLASVINSQRIDGVELTPTVASALLGSRQRCPSLKCLLTIGEMLNTQIIQEFGSHEEDQGLLYAMYGPTEAAIHCTMFPCLHSSSVVGNIGYPLRTVSAFVAAEGASDFIILPLGQRGELVIGGHQLADGYLNQDEETSQAFIFTSQYGRLYRTGDRARLLPDGTLQVMGRVKDGQIKLRGQRMELGEVESVAMSNPLVKLATALTIEDTIVLFYVEDTACTPTASVEQACKTWLPAFMVPAEFVPLPELPRTASGKLDKDRLRSQYINKNSHQTSKDIDVSDVEKEILKIIRDSVGVLCHPSDDFLRAGLDSLKAIRVASHLAKNGFCVNVPNLLSAKTIRELVAKLQREEGGISSTRSRELQPYQDICRAIESDAKAHEILSNVENDVQAVVPCTPMQNGMLVETMKSGSAYCNAIELRIIASYTEIVEALMLVLNAHEIFRSGFVPITSSHGPYARVIWRHLDAENILNTTNFERKFEIETNEELLRPLSVQIARSDEWCTLLFHIHHALYDGWSWDIFLSDLETTIKTQRCPQGSRFRDYVESLYNWLYSDAGKASENYWRKVVSNVRQSPLPDLSTRPNNVSLSHTTVQTHIQSADLESFSKSIGVHPQSIIISAIGILQADYVNSEEVVLGVVTAGRTLSLPAIEEIIGPCIATLPLRLHLNGSIKVEDYVKQSQAKIREMLAYSNTPLSRIRKASGIPTNSSLYDIVVVWQEGLQRVQEDGGLIDQLSANDKIEQKVLLELEPNPDRLNIRATFQDHKISSNQMRMMLAQIESLSSGILNARDSCIHDLLNHIPENDLSIANAFPATSVPRALSYYVEFWAKQRPERLAIDFVDTMGKSGNQFRRMTYKQLNDRANNLARHLFEIEISDGDVLCVLMHKSPELYVSALAIAKLNATYLPVTPDTPLVRLSEICDMARPKLCLVQSNTISLIEQVGSISSINMDTITLESTPFHNIRVSRASDVAAYLIFTSGSTGRPKGVPVTHRNLSSNLEQLDKIYPRSDEKSRLLQACSQSFDVSLFEIFFTWLRGMCLVSASKDLIFNDIEKFINRANVTHLSLTPTVAAMLNHMKVPNVKFLVTAGEPMTEIVQKNWRGCKLFNGYGPSETTNICTVQPYLAPNDPSSLVGPPLPNTSAFVLAQQEDFRILPKCSLGELCFGGDQVFPGYLQQSDLSHNKIIQHPRYGKLFRSGDLGVMLADGSMLCLGRVDGQVKIRGQRVELGEISAVIGSHASVESCVTTTIKTGSTGIAQLVSFWTRQAGTVESACHVEEIDPAMERTTSHIFQHILRQVPEYMCPQLLIPLSKLPKTGNDKIDYSRLRKIAIDLGPNVTAKLSRTTDLDQHDELELSELELVIVRALSRLLAIPEHDIHRGSSFYGLGIDSVSAVSLAQILRSHEQMTFDVETSHILRYPSVNQLARFVEQQPESNASLYTSSSEVSAAFPKGVYDNLKHVFDDVEAIFPCTPMQTAMLFSSSCASASAYCNKTVFHVRGDVERLKSAWRQIIKQEGILRTYFATTDFIGYPYAQIVRSSAYFPWRVVDIEGNPEGHIDDESLSILESKKPPFALTQVNSRLDDKTYIILSMHHALYDGIGLQNLIREVERLYNGGELAYPPSFENFLKYMMAIDVDAADQYWRHHFQGFEPSYLPNLTGKSARATKPLAGYHISERALNIPLSRAQMHCKSISTTLYSILEASLAKILRYLYDSEDVCFGSVISCRHLPVKGLNRVIAPCFNTLPVRIRCNSNTSNRSLCLQLNEVNAAHVPFQLTSLRRIQSTIGSTGRRLFDTLLILQHSDIITDESIWSLVDERGAMDFPLVFEIIPNASKDILTVRTHSQRSIILDQDTRFILDAFEESFESCIYHPTDPTSRVYRSADAQNAASQEPVNTSSRDGLLHSIFERSAEMTPEALALCFLEERNHTTCWSFKQLDEKAEEIAQSLLAAGVQVEDSVPIHLTKSPLFYASLLAVLKAGAAFTPIDPQLPEDRKVFMLKELGAQLILADNEQEASWCKTRILNVHDAKPSVKTIQKPLVSTCNAAYRLYTSGSTGRPKAVCVEHQSAFNTINASREFFRVTPKSRLLQYAATTFDMCYFDCFLAFSLGISLVSAPQAILYNDIATVINKFDVTFLDLTPSVANTIQPSQVPQVQQLYCIGEAMTQDVVEAWKGKCVNSYGPTEASMCVTITEVDENIDPNVIGRPFETTSFTILSEDDYEVPRLGTGELCIGGSQLAREYHANEELTSRKFAYVNGRRVYKTGDKVRKLGNGTFQFIGRADDQVKIRGLRVELGEINSTIQECDPDVKSAHTQLLKASASASTQIVSFIVSDLDPKHHRKIQETARSACHAKLPMYMIPAAFIVAGRIPLSSAGKTDRGKLLEMFRSRLEESPTHENDSAWSHVELTVRDVLADLSKTDVQTLKRSTTIFLLGLDSISAVQIASMLRKHHLQISASEVMRNPTVTGIATSSQYTEPSNDSINLQEDHFDFESFEKRHHSAVSGRYNIKSTSIARIRPCTSFQAGSVAEFIHTQGSAYFNFNKIELASNLRMETITEGFDVIFEKYGILRTGFVSLDDEAHPFGMITYRARCYEPPVELLNGDFTWEEWLERHRRKAFSRLHEPPWAALLERTDDAIFLNLAMHHALYDATSLNLILEDLMRTLNGEYVSSKEVSIDPTIEKILRSSQRRDAKDFWKSFEGNTLINRFPNLQPLKPSDSDQQTASRSSTHPLSELDQACRQWETTLSLIGQAAWGRLLSAYLGENVVTFGTVLSGRTDDEVAATAFPCINVVPTTVNAAASTASLLKDLKQFLASAQSFQFTALRDVQRWLGFGDDAPFDTLFTFQKPWHASNHLCNMIRSQGTVEYPISIELEPKADGQLEYRLVYTRDMMSEDHADLVLKQLDTLVGDTLQLKPQKQKQIDDELFSIRPPKEKLIPSESVHLHGLVEEQVKKSPNKVAFEFATDISASRKLGQSWTYAELDRAGNKLAHLLLDHGVTQGSLVAMCFEKCPEASFAMLGILKAGCGLLAIDPGAPNARKSFIIGDSAASIVLTSGSLSGSLDPSSDCPILVVDQELMSNRCSSQPRLVEAIKPSDTCYCLYTSGTTGTPKGCVVNHESAVQAMMAFRRLFKWNENSRWFQFASYHFDVAILEHFWTWSTGLCMVGAPRDIIFEDLAGTITKLDIDHIDLTPSLAQTLDPKDVPSLCRPDSVFITGGEALKDDIITKWGSYRTIYNGYGPTEATIGCTMYPRVPPEGKSTNIGFQFDNVGALVIDPKSGDTVLKGASGELCVYGPLVADGYLSRPDKTAESFQYFDINGQSQRVYRTGDLVRMHHDGSFGYLGRTDDQVKLRGQRIETREINVVAKGANQDIIDVSTLKIKHPKLQKEQLVSFFGLNSVSDNGRHSILRNSKASVVIKDIKQSCRKHLPGFAVPTYFMPLTSLPLTTNNKIDAKKLREIFEGLAPSELQSADGGTEEASEPLSIASEGILKLLCKHLQLSTIHASVQRDTSIFELGLDSITAIGFSDRLKRAGYSRASTSLVMKNARLDDLTNALLDSRRNTHFREAFQAKQSILATDQRFRTLAAQQLGVKQSDVDCVAPCTPLQQGIISRSFQSDHPIYFVDFRFELFPEINMSRLRKAFESVVLNTQIMRTRFICADEGYLQVALKQGSVKWTDRASESSDDMTSILNAEYATWSHDPSYSITSHPWEVITCRSSSSIQLALHMFHALYDGNSLPLLLEAVLAHYHEKPPLSGPSFFDVLPYGPLNQLHDAEQFWVATLSNVVNSRKLKSINATSSARVVAPIKRRFNMPTNLEQCRRSLNATQQAMMQAIWSSVLTKHFGLTIMGLVVSGRSIEMEGVDHTIGPLFNTLPFLLSLNKSSTWRQAVVDTHQFNVATLPYQHTSLRDITRWLISHDLLASGPLIESLFVFQRNAASRTDLAAIWKAVGEGAITADYPLSFEVEQLSSSELSLTLVAQDWLAKDQDLVELLDDFEVAMNALAANPKATIVQTLPLPPHSSNISNKDNHENDAAEPASSGSAIADTGFQWSSEAEQIRTEIADLCGLPASTIDANSSILELGLDSVDAVKLSSRLNRRRNIRLPVSSIMRSLSIAGMSKHANRHESGPSAGTENVSLNSIKRRLRDVCLAERVDLTDVESLLPTSPMQEAIIAEMEASSFRHYLNHDVLRLSPNLNLQKFKDAWQTVVDANPILRTSLRQLDTLDSDLNCVQIVHKPSPLQWHERTISELTGSLKDMLNEIRKSYTSRSDRHPATDLTMAHSTAEEHSYLIISMPHALYDGWSLQLLHHDVQAAYYGKCPLRPEPEPLLRGILDTSESLEASNFWTDVLQGISPTKFHPRQMQEVGPLTHRFERWSALPTKSLQQYIQKNNVSMSSLTQAAFSILLASLTQKLDVVFGVVLSCRESEEDEQIMFPAMNTVPVRTVMHGSRLDMVKYMQDTMNNIRPYEKYPLRKAISKAQRERGVQKLFDALFLFQRRPKSAADSTSGELYHSVASASEVEYPLAVEAEVGGDVLIWRNACQNSVFDETESSGVLQTLDEILQAIVSGPSAPSLDFSGSGVSICGLPAFKKTDDEFTQNGWQSRSPARRVEGGHSDPVILYEVRRIVSQVAQATEDNVRDHSTIFSLGLDSISAIKVCRLLRKSGIEITVGKLLGAATIEQIAAIATPVDRLEPEGDSAFSSESAAQLIQSSVGSVDMAPSLSTSGLEEEDVEKVLPATAGQVYMLAMHAKHGLFMPTFKYQLTVPHTTLDHLTQAWNRLVISTPILRTLFIPGTSPSLFIQVILSPHGAAQYAAQNPPINPTPTNHHRIGTHTPFIHLTATTISTSRLNLSLQVHHALYDGVSLPLLITRLSRLLHDPFSSPPPSAADITSAFTSSIAKTLTPPALEDAQQFWSSYLSNLNLDPTQTKGETPSTNRIETFNPNFLSPTKIHSLQTLARENNTTLHALFLAAIARAVYTAGREVVLGVYLANRENAEILSAPTLNVVPLRVRDPTAPLPDVARAVQNDLQSISEGARAWMSLARIAAWTGLSSIGVTVNFLAMPAEEDEPGEEQSMLVPVGDGNRDADEGYERVVEAPEPPGEGALGMGVENEEAMSVYRAGVDVEARVLNGGLGVGVFCGEDVNGLDEVKELRGRLAQILEEAGGIEEGSG